MFNLFDERGREVVAADVFCRVLFAVQLVSSVVVEGSAGSVAQPRLNCADTHGATEMRLLMEAFVRAAGDAERWLVGRDAMRPQEMRTGLVVVSARATEAVD